MFAGALRFPQVFDLPWTWPASLSPGLEAGSCRHRKFSGVSAHAQAALLIRLYTEEADASFHVHPLKIQNSLPQRPGMVITRQVDGSVDWCIGEGWAAWAPDAQ